MRSAYEEKYHKLEKYEEEFTNSIEPSLSKQHAKIEDLKFIIEIQDCVQFR